MRMVANLIPIALVGGLLLLLGFPLVLQLFPGLRGSQTVQIQRASGNSSTSGVPEMETLTIINILPKDAIRAIDDPLFLSAQDGSPWMRAEELVIGVSIDGESKA